MKIRLRFIAVAIEDVPPRNRDGCSEMEISSGMTVEQFLESLALPKDGAYLTLVNEESVPVRERSVRCLREDDLVTIFSPIKGG